GRADAFLAAITDTLKPFVDRYFRTRAEPRMTGIAGVSLGGLLALYATYSTSGVFGSAIAISPTYDYATGGIYDVLRSRSRPTNVKAVAQLSGYPNDNDISLAEALLLKEGFTTGVDLLSVAVPGAEHNTACWTMEYDTALRFLYGTGRAKPN